MAKVDRIKSIWFLEEETSHSTHRNQALKAHTHHQLPQLLDQAQVKLVLVGWLSWLELGRSTDSPSQRFGFFFFFLMECSILFIYINIFKIYFKYNDVFIYFV